MVAGAPEVGAAVMSGGQNVAMRNFLQHEVKLEGLNFKDIEVNPFNNSMVSLIQEIGISGITGTVLVPKDWVLLNRALTLCWVCAIPSILPSIRWRWCGLMRRSWCKTSRAAGWVLCAIWYKALW